MNRSRKLIATRALRLAALALLLCGAAAAGRPVLAAPVAGTVLQLSGPMQARKPDGTLKALAQKSEFESGDTLITSASAYALVRLLDSSEITLKPSTTLDIEQFQFDGGQPGADRASLRLVKGAMRTVTGLLGKRNKEKFVLGTPSATIGIRGTTFILEYIVEGQPQPSGQAPSDLIPPAPLPPGGLAPGLHVYVADGGISISNEAGQFQYDPGQFGYIKDYATRPVKMTSNPGMQFAPPAWFVPPTNEYSY